MNWLVQVVNDWVKAVIVLQSINLPEEDPPFGLVPLVDIAQRSSGHACVKHSASNGEEDSTRDGVRVVESRLWPVFKLSLI